jgi:predicted MPP superfamily phosphohydrolase
MPTAIVGERSSGKSRRKGLPMAPRLDTVTRISRRELLTRSGSLIAGLSAGALFARAGEQGRKALLRFGIVTDAHYADANPGGKRHYRESLPKMAECVALMNEQKVDFLIELGDLKDQAKPPAEKSTLAYLRAIEGAFQKFKGSAYHVLGNHDMDSISKAQFLAVATNTGIPRTSSYYSFDLKGLHFVVLDANYRADGSDYNAGNFQWTDANVPKAELAWLRADLAAASRPVVAFVHQQLDGKGSHYVKNARDVRLALQKHKNVLAVFQGHNHAGHYSRIEGVHYYTLKAMVEGTGEANSSYAVVEVYDNHDIAVTGYRRAPSKALPRA